MKHSPDSDSLQLQPGSVLVIAKVLDLDKVGATLEILEVKGSGQGIINVPSQGAKLTVKVDRNILKSAHQTIEAYLKEEMDIDASQSTYRLVEITRIVKD